MPSALQTSRMAALRDLLARLEGDAHAARFSDARSGPVPAIPFGLPALDRHLPAGGIARGALHEIAGAGAEQEHGAAAALLIAGLLARLPGPVLWVLERPDLFAPALAAMGLAPDRVIYAEAGTPETVLLVLEEGLRHPGLAAGVGEISGRLGLTATRRLQLAAATSGATGFLLRRAWRGQTTEAAEPSAAVSRWRVGALPSAPPLAAAPDVPGLGPARWRLDLLRCRGAEPASWILEVCDATGDWRLAAALADREAAPDRRRAAG